MKRTTLWISLLLLFLFPALSGQDYPYLTDRGGLDHLTSASGISAPATIRVVYDNYAAVDGMAADWGYSIVIKGLEKEILFDTGTNPELFLSNFKKMGLDASEIDMLVLSHEHYDHTGGISTFVKMKTGIPVIMPHSFTPTFLLRIDSMGFTPLLVKEPAMVCDHLFTTGEFDFALPEHALVLDTRNGLVLMTGCSHPGIVEMVRQVRTAFGKNVYMIFGGFHLMNKTREETTAIIDSLKSLGVVRCGATHCTGEMQITMFRQAFGDDYVDLGAGNTIIIN